MLVKRSILIVLIGNRTLNEHQLALLKRELKELEIV